MLHCCLINHRYTCTLVHLLSVAVSKVIYLCLFNFTVNNNYVNKPQFYICKMNRFLWIWWIFCAQKLNVNGLMSILSIPLSSVVKPFILFQCPKNKFLTRRNPEIETI